MSTDCCATGDSLPKARSLLATRRRSQCAAPASRHSIYRCTGVKYAPCSCRGLSFAFFSSSAHFLGRPIGKHLSPRPRALCCPTPAAIALHSRSAALATPAIRLCPCLSAPGEGSYASNVGVRRPVCLWDPMVLSEDGNVEAALKSTLPWDTSVLVLQFLGLPLDSGEPDVRGRT
jgi:hypothetical protein